MTVVDTSIRIAIVDENPLRSAIITEGLREGGYRDVTVIAEMRGLVAAIASADPDVILIGLENPSRDVLEQMFTLSRIVKRPVAMFVDQSDESQMEAAIAAGVSAYVVDGFKKERIKPILAMSIIRFRAFSRLQDELAETKMKLQQRDTVDKAKRVLMRMKNLSEEEAYASMRKTAMNEKRRISEIASAILTAADLLR